MKNRKVILGEYGIKVNDIIYDFMIEIEQETFALNTKEDIVNVGTDLIKDYVSDFGGTLVSGMTLNVNDYYEKENIIGAIKVIIIKLNKEK